jgi:hypothetical protein
MLNVMSSIEGASVVQSYSDKEREPPVDILAAISIHEEAQTYLLKSDECTTVIREKM